MFWERTFCLLVHDCVPFLPFIEMRCIVTFDVRSGPEETHVSHLKEKKQQNSREKKCVDFESNTSFFMSFSLPKHFVTGYLSLKLSDLKALYRPKKSFNFKYF